MNVLILPAGGAHAQRKLVSTFQTLLRDAGDANPRLDREPPRRAAAVGERSHTALADTVESYQGVVQVFIRCLGEEAQPVADLAPTVLLARRRSFWGEDAWRNLALWIREHPGAEAPSWQADVRADLDWVVRDAKVGQAASLFDIASPKWVARNGGVVDDAEEQRRLQAQVADLIGAVHEESLQAEDSSERVSRILAEKHARSQEAD